MKIADSVTICTTLFRMGLFGAAHGWVGVKRFPLPKIYHMDETSYIDKTRHNYTLPKEDTKDM